MSDALAILVAALPGLAAVAAGTVRWRADRRAGRAWRRMTPLARIALVSLAALVLAACHTTHQDHFAKGPVPVALVPFAEPLRWSVGPQAGDDVPPQNGLLATYFRGALYDFVDHQQIDPNVDFQWDVTNQNPVIPGATVANEGLDRDDCGFCGLPSTWGIFSIVWEGYLEAPTAGSYLLRIHVNNGGWLEMKDPTGRLQTVIGGCAGGPGFEGDCDATVSLAAGRHYIRFSFFQNGPPSANAFLMWSPPGASDFAVVPQSSLFTGANARPVVDAGGDTEVFAGSTLQRGGSFVDPDANDSWTATVEYGDGSPAEALPLGPDKRFSLMHRYDAPGSYRVTVVVSDARNASGSGSFLVTVKRRPLVFIPGVPASELVATADHVGPSAVRFTTSRGTERTVEYRAGETVWVDFGRASTDPQYYEFLALAQDGGSAPDLAPGPRMFGYDATLTALTTAGYVIGRDLFTFTYDWRYLGDRHVARLDAIIGGILAATGAPNVDIVAHSMGTLVARSFLSDGAQRDRVSHAVLVGGPLLGTPRGTLAVVAGVCVLELFSFVCVIPPINTQYVLRTLPGGLANGVAPTYYEVFDGRDRRHPFAYEDRTTPAGLPQSQTYAALREVILESGAFVTALQVAEAFHQDDAIWLSPTAGRVVAPVSLVAGTGRCSIGQVVKRTQTVFAPGPIGLRPAGFRTTYDTRMIDGDGTVVRQSATLNDPQTGFVANHASPIYYRAGSEHGALVAGPDMAAIVRLLDGDPPPVGAPRNPTCFTFGIGSPMEFEIVDASGRRLGTLDGATVRQEIPGASYDRIVDHKAAVLHEPGAHRVTIRGTGDGDSTIRLRSIADGTVVSEAVFLHVPTTPQTRATVTFDSVTSTAGELELDHNGDGVVDQRLAPRVLTGAAAEDETAPAIALVRPTATQIVGEFVLDWTATDLESGVAGSFAVLDRGTGTESIVERPGPVRLAPGPHSIEVFAENGLGLLGSLRRDVTVASHRWLPPLADGDGHVENAGRTIPVKFTVAGADGRFVEDASLRVKILDDRGAAAVGPFGVGTSPSDSVKIQSDSYHVNVPTTGLLPGSYTIEASFDSPQLEGALRLPLTLR